MPIPEIPGAYVVYKEGGLYPTRFHQTLLEATNEAERLNKKEIEKVFHVFKVVFQYVKSCKVVSTIWYIEDKGGL